MIPQNDRGLLLGDGLFETLLAVDGEPAHLAAHLDRMAAGCAALALPFDRDEAERRVRDIVPAEGRFAVRLTLTAGSGGRGLDRPSVPLPRLFATAAPSTAPEVPATAVLATTRRNEGSPASRLKTLSYLDNVLARREAAGAEALMLNTAGQVACAAAANLFWVRDGRLLTPSLDCGVLEGIMRGVVIARARSRGIVVEEVHADRAALDGAEGLFLTNSLIGVRAVSMLDGRPVAQSPLTALVS